jgi:xanthine dehydrogenase accessory factor
MPHDIYEEIAELRRQGQPCAVATIVSRKGSTPRKDPAKMLIRADGAQMGSIGGGCTEAEVVKEALQAMRSEKPKMLSFDLTDDDAEESGLLCGGTMEVYVEPVIPDPLLIVCGAGHIGQCVADIAKTLGFRLAIVDDRLKFANPDRFPQADQFYVDSWEQVLAKIPVTEASYFLIATRGHKYDLTCLRFAVQTPARYVGLLGSRRKTKLLYETLQKEGIDPANFERVYAPVGIEIGSETPEEIAVSIAAELIAVRKKLDVRPLKETARLIRPAAVAQPQRESA